MVEAVGYWLLVFFELIIIKIVMQALAKHPFPVFTHEAAWILHFVQNDKTSKIVMLSVSKASRTGSGIKSGNRIPNRKFGMTSVFCHAGGSEASILQFSLMRLLGFFHFISFSVRMTRPQKLSC